MTGKHMRIRICADPSGYCDGCERTEAKTAATCYYSPTHRAEVPVAAETDGAA